MHVVEERLAVDGELLDVDVTDDGSWVGLVRTGSGSQHLLFGEGRPAVPPRLFERPMVRAAGPDRAVLVEAEDGWDDEENGYLVTSTGTVESVFNLGWGINDVLVSTDHVVVIYHDEGIFRAGAEGVAVFDLGGKLTLGYNSSPDSAIFIDDCYCAAWGEARQLFFYAHTGDRCRLVELDLESMHQDFLPSPYNVYGSGALSVARRGSRDELFLFHGPSDDPAGIYRCRVDDIRAERIGIREGPLRGLTGGRFLAAGTTGHTIVSTSNSKAVWERCCRCS
jgi:hypothetical protein